MKFYITITYHFQTTEDNSSSERVFDKTEANYNSEPLLIAEWMRIMRRGNIRHQINSISDIMDYICPYLAVDGLKWTEISFELRYECREFLSARVLRCFLDG